MARREMREFNVQSQGLVKEKQGLRVWFENPRQALDMAEQLLRSANRELCNDESERREIDVVVWGEWGETEPMEGSEGEGDEGAGDKPSELRLKLDEERGLVGHLRDMLEDAMAEVNQWKTLCQDARADEQQAMTYLEQCRQAVGHEGDFPSLVERLRRMAG